MHINKHWHFMKFIESYLQNHLLISILKIEFYNHNENIMLFLQ